MYAKLFGLESNKSIVSFVSVLYPLKFKNKILHRACVSDKLMGGFSLYVLKAGFKYWNVEIYLNIGWVLGYWMKKLDKIGIVSNNK